ncbi:response regulator [Dactylosporangium sp. NPDC049525]|uniref:response regulator n=1 Tax=Dactylosporangium sp. NPDC049525 TaxID=3154730 RepID=UPI00343C75B9
MASTVLIVDDSLTVRMDLHEAFEDGGFRTVLCGSGADARNAFDAEQFDVALFDVLLPDADGVDLLRELRAHPRHAGVVALLLSSEAEVSDRLRGLRHGADDYVGKPYDAHAVVARSRELLQRGADPPAERSVLVIDDSLTFREELRQLLTSAGYEVQTAVSGEEGLRAAAARPPSAIIVDGILPGIDGATVIRRIRLDATLRNVPCLLLTAADDYATELQILDAGADAFVRKQENLTVVLAKLAAVLRKSTDTPLPAAGPFHGQVKVLLVDADRVFLDQAAELLREEGYEPVAAPDADDALAMLAVQPAGCVVLAVDVPGVDGLALCSRIRSVPGLRDMPVIGLGAGDALLDCLAAGADDYVRRTDGANTLRAHIRAHIRRQQLHEQNRRIRDELVRRELEAAQERAARQVAETRAELVEELEWRNRELEAFSGSVSHDLRSPLQTILSFSELLLEEQSGKEPADLVLRIHKAARRMNALIDALLELAGANRGQIQRAEVDLSALAADVVEELRQRDPGRAVEITVETGMRASCDGELVRAVLVNLVGNAWKFTGRTPSPRIEIGRSPQAFYIRDNGAGFPAERADQLFRPFGRLHDSSDFPGTGIGLTTVQRIVDRHGGRVWAQSEPGCGATFSFTLPDS